MGAWAPVAAAAPAPAPAWSLVLTTYPTNLTRETSGSASAPPGYLLIATNIGSAETGGQFSIEDTLPPGLAFSTPAGATGLYGAQGHPLECNAGGQTVVCTGGLPTLKPGETARLTIPVAIASTAVGPVRDQATVGGGGAASTVATTEAALDGEPAGFALAPGEGGFYGAITNADGTPTILAGSHPDQFSAGMNFASTSLDGQSVFPDGGGVRDLSVDLPTGVVVNPAAISPSCTEVQLEGGGCPDSTQVGVLTAAFALSGMPLVETHPIYAMAAQPGAPFKFGVELKDGVYVHIFGHLRTETDYGMSAAISDIPATAPILGAGLVLWGNPSAESHDYVRGKCLSSGGACPVPRTDAALLTTPGKCDGPLGTGVRADGWIEPGVFVQASVESPAVNGCNALPFEPTIAVRPSTRIADSPSGLNVAFHLSQNEDFGGRTAAELRDVAVAMPEGMVVNPAAGAGRTACSPDQIGLLTPPGQGHPRFSAVAGSCPDSAKIGTVEVGTPLLDHRLSGAIYLAKPYENPFGSLLAVYLAISDPTSRLTIKLAGEVDADPRSGHITLTLVEAPELPIEDVKLNFFGGPGAVLKTPLPCGAYSAHAELTPWSSPDGVDVSASDTFAVDSAAGGAETCPSTEADAPNRPDFSAGTIAPRAGAYSPFVLRLSRQDGSQRLAGVDATLPPGLIARLAGVPLCAEAQIAAASCPTASEVGRVDIGAGAGSAPLHLSGRAYLAGSYEGAPSSLEVLTQAVAGPLNLGTVSVRIALYVDLQTAQVRAVSDSLPTILRGIPLDLRSIAVELDRPNFVLNPTSCEATAIRGEAISDLGQMAVLGERFQVANCGRLPFEPRLGLHFAGATGRNGHPALRAVLRATPHEAGIAGAAFTLPAGELLDLHHVGALCARQLPPELCPRASRLGEARVWSPLLGEPLQGSIYLRAPSGRLPDLLVDLRAGQLHLVLQGHTATAGGRLRVSFPALPDVPLSKAVLTLAGGRRGILVNSESLCARPRRAEVSLSAHNGKRLRLRPRLGLRGC